MQILVVEDEPKVGNALREGLESEGYEVTLTRTGEEGFFQASTRAFELIILDVMLPGRDRIEVLQTLRKQGMKTPVLLLTAKDAIEDRVLGLDAGADDYLVKPFAFARHASSSFLSTWRAIMAASSLARCWPETYGRKRQGQRRSTT